MKVDEMQDNLKCPYCGRGMEKGMIRSGHELNWSDKKYLFNRAEFHPRSVLLGELDFFRGTSVTAWLCRECKKVIIDYGDSK